MHRDSLKTRRRAVLISQNKLAKISNVSRFRLVMFELGEGELTKEELARLDKALQAEVARIRDRLAVTETFPVAG